VRQGKELSRYGFMLTKEKHKLLVKMVKQSGFTLINKTNIYLRFNPVRFEFTLETDNIVLWTGKDYSFVRIVEFSRGFCSNLVDTNLIIGDNISSEFYITVEELEKKMFKGE
jgi:hypothetical protein